MAEARADGVLAFPGGARAPRRKLASLRHHGLAMTRSDSCPPSDLARDTLARQLGVAWQLTTYHLQDLTTEECLRRPAERGLHVHQQADGTWRADWPEHEGYDLGPSSIGWMTWHLGFWWSMALDHNFGSRTLTREDIAWPGTAESARAWIFGLHARWRDALSAQAEADLATVCGVHWPFEGRPRADLFAWANTELTKSAAEIGYARFLLAVSAPTRDPRPGPRPPPTAHGCGA